MKRFIKKSIPSIAEFKEKPMKAIAKTLLWLVILCVMAYLAFVLLVVFFVLSVIVLALKGSGSSYYKSQDEHFEEHGDYY